MHCTFLLHKGQVPNRHEDANLRMHHFLRLGHTIGLQSQAIQGKIVALVHLPNHTW